MKIKLTRNELNTILENCIKRCLEEEMNEAKRKFDDDYEMDYVKANRKGNRDAEREIKGPGFKSNTKVHKSMKNYSRKGKNKFSYNGDEE